MPARSNGWHGLDVNHHPLIREVINRVARWHNDHLSGIVLAGDTGCGKSHLCQRIYRASGGNVSKIIADEDGFLTSMRYAIFREEPELLDDIRATFDGQDSAKRIIGELRRARLLILDDIGVGHVKEDSLGWYHDIMWKIFNQRAEKGYRTMITTNLGLGELGTRIGKRAFSRLGAMLDNGEWYIDMFDIPDYRLRNWKR